MIRITPPRFQRNQGAILFVALIMLLLLTLLGVTAMQVTLLQERMSGNYRAQQVAFERAEGRMAEGRDLVTDPLYAYDNISPVPVGLSGTDGLPWDSWLTTFPPSREFEQSVRACGGACPEQRGSIVADDPNKKPRFYVISGQEKDPGSPEDSAAWATVQTIYVF
ncbi:MAG: PilX N-terminal domain-containing pilus assembly protein [Dokdonella sp.]|uniref:pilus assembly PilX family protein n=1 Tax=Dokdonella sp. TaxID=2291710 RepID=UPI002C5C5EE2|nr:PilX N-terminal domain-containing pilus assembly protein [Dokdonella sp.]HOX72174.1 PilX N-terminal domain-containing pilus assembly protein [Dokdonella sp.]HPN79497.1 PilX N-terminal domain-containing pilus assembly protein [Dokdonella sp.]